MKLIDSKIGRSSKKDIINDYKNIISNPYFKKLLDSIPNIVAIINSNRQIIFSNSVMLEQVKLISIEDILGARIGESIDCKNSAIEETGCGTCEHCNYCGANLAIRESQSKKITITNECRIISETNSSDTNFEFAVTVTPLEWDNKSYSIVSLNDISNTKRRLMLERIFLHDIVNKIGSLNCYLELVNETKGTDKSNEFLKGAIDLSKDLTDDIISQRELIAAEANSLVVEKIYLKTKDIINVVVNQMRHHEVIKDKFISIDTNTINETIYTDYSLIKRVLVNLIKNALEAIETNETVTVGCNKIENKIIFWVHNPGLMKREIELQIFQRSFSTKNNNRGLGTYSIKLLTEKYMGGKVNFTTNKKNGTRFNIILNS